MFTGKIIAVAAFTTVIAFTGCDRKRQERVAQTEKLNHIEEQLAYMQGKLDSSAAAPQVVYQQPMYSSAPMNGGLTLNPDDNGAIVQITDFGIAPAPAARSTASSRRAEVARLGQSTPAAKNTPAKKGKSTAKKSPAKNNYAKSIAVSGLSATDVQKALNNAGYNPGKIDGKVGPNTVAAIKNFQRVEGLTADGIVGRRTWEKLSVHLTGGSGSAASVGMATDSGNYIPASDFTF